MRKKTSLSPRLPPCRPLRQTAHVQKKATLPLKHSHSLCKAFVVAPDSLFPSCVTWNHRYVMRRGALNIYPGVAPMRKRSERLFRREGSPCVVPNFYACNTSRSPNTDLRTKCEPGGRHAKDRNRGSRCINECCGAPPNGLPGRGRTFRIAGMLELSSFRESHSEFT